MKKIKEFFNFFIEFYKDVKELKKSNEKSRKIKQEIERSDSDDFFDAEIERLEQSDLYFDIHERE